MLVNIQPSLRPMSVWLSDFIGGTGHRTQYRRGIELRLDADCGLYGLGEASPLPHFSAEHQEDADAELERIRPFEAELPESPAACHNFVSVMLDRTNCRTASARFAVEGALIDLCAKHFELPAAQLIAEMHAQTAQQIPELTVSKLLVGGDKSSLLGQARRAMARGYRTFKLKLGTVEQFEGDLDIVDALRQQLGRELSIRLDPNRSWPFGELPRLLDRLKAINPELVEEPAAVARLVELERTPVPLALDESLRDDGSLEAVAPHLGRIDIRAVVIKPALLGLMRSIELAHQARRLGLAVIVTHLFDGPVGHATAASVALAVGNKDRAHGLAPHAGLLLNPKRRIQGLGAGKIHLVEQSGLPLAEVG